MKYRSNSIEHCSNIKFGSQVTLAGWVHNIRDLGKLIFIQLREKEAIIQITINEETNPDLFKLAKTIKNEWVIQVIGILQNKQSNSEKKDLTHFARNMVKI